MKRRQCFSVTAILYIPVFIIGLIRCLAIWITSLHLLRTDEEIIKRNLDITESIIMSLLIFVVGISYGCFNWFFIRKCSGFSG